MTAHRPTGAPAPAPSTTAVTADTATARTGPTAATDVAAATDDRIADALTARTRRTELVAGLGAFPERESHARRGLQRMRRSLEPAGAGAGR